MLATVTVFTGLVTLTTTSRIPLVVFQRFDIHRIADFEDSTLWPLEEIPPADTRPYSNVEPRILYQVGVSFFSSFPVGIKNRKTFAVPFALPRERERNLSNNNNNDATTNA